jgi:hypothetical protein
MATIVYNTEWKNIEIEKFFKTNPKWKKANAPSGKVYYYEKGSSTTQWQKPQELVDLEEKLDKIIAENSMHISSNEEKKDKSPTKPSVVEEEKTLDTNNNMGKPSIVPLKLPTVGGINLKTVAKPSKPVAINPFGSSVNDSDEEEEVQSQPQTVAVSSSQQTNATSRSSTSNQNSEEAAKRTPAIEDQEKSEEQLTEIIKMKDSLLEEDCIPNSRLLIQKHKRGPKFIVEALTTSYHGYPQMSKILLEWITCADSLLLQSREMGGNASAQVKLPTEAETIRAHEARLIELLSSLILDKFDKKRADELFLQFKHHPVWLKELLENEHLRSSILSLLKRNPDSLLLQLCSKEIHLHYSLASKSKRTSTTIETHLKRMEQYFILSSSLVLDLIKVKCM